MTPDERCKIQNELIQKTEGIIRCMRSDAQAGLVSNLAEFAEKIADVTKSIDFPVQRAQELLTSAILIQRDAYEKRIGETIIEINHALHAGNETTKNELIAKIYQDVSMAMRFGTDEAFRVNVDKRLQLIHLTTQGGVDKRTKAEAERKNKLSNNFRVPMCKSPGGKERRRAQHYIEPVLFVQIDGISYQTINWSTRGLLIKDYPYPVSVGRNYKVILSNKYVSDSGQNWARIARIVPEHYQIALEFPDISTAILNIMHQFRVAGIHPEPG